MLRVKVGDGWRDVHTHRDTDREGGKKKLKEMDKGTDRKRERK